MLEFDYNELYRTLQPLTITTKQKHDLRKLFDYVSHDRFLEHFEHALRANRLLFARLNSYLEGIDIVKGLQRFVWDTLSVDTVY